ncbi:sensor histidine kinase [Pseudobacillus wudalianchiensis]|uniref:Heme sensor protein HssS n=1 Tax=Pseudobacillus wudalianchiensis TaxID=1743143 RepID=A0A1B9AAD9_9BACI|nr:HAMP domain-containing sensor histidine kinase [Bacillus wudalianchiensis]OCA80812.1 two-component sensor histidine kinase [Bacillus wudalianchiensis]
MKSLYGKFVLMTALIMVFSTIGGFLVTNTYYHRVMKARNDEKNVEIAKTIVDHIEETPQENLDEYLKTIGRIGYQLYVVDELGKSSFYGGDFRLKNLDRNSVEQVLAGHVYHGMRDFPRETFVTGFFANEMSNTIGVPFKHDNKQYALFIRPDIKLLFSEVHTILAGLIIATALLSLLAMLLVAKMLIVPITQLTAATKRIADEKYDTQLNIDRHDEIGQLAASFNTMVGQLQENDKIRKEFISNVSHDFQSPLLNIQGYAGLLKGGNISDEERKNYAEVIQSETNRLSKLTRQLLLLTSLDQSSRMVKYRDYRLDEQLKACINKYRWWLEEDRLNLHMKMEATTYRGDEALFENVWENLLTNAIKYNRPEGEIHIALEKKDGYIEVIVQDTGIGISEAEQSQLFNRFYRADTSRTKEGTGLGLSIVKQIIELHKGNIHVTSKPGEGTTFTIKLLNL